MARLAPMLVWCLLVLAGTIFLIFFGRSSGPAAMRKLPMNTYLMAGDLSYPSYSGRYVMVPNGLAQGASLRPFEVAGQPDLIDGPQGEMLLLVNTDRTAVMGGLNAGSATQLCGKAPTVYGGVTVLAVRCEADRSNSRCVAAVDLPKSFASDLVTKAFKDQAATAELRLATKCD